MIMIKKKKKKEAFAKALEVFGPWRTWSRGQHLAYGLVRGVPYSAMERCANNNPHFAYPTILARLILLGALEKAPYGTDASKEQEKLLNDLIVWVKKPTRGPRVRPTHHNEAAR